MSALDTVIGYVEGKISSTDFCNHLYNDKSLEELLSEDVDIPPYTRSGSVYQYLLGEDFSTAGGRLNSKDVLGKFLKKKDVSYVEDKEAQKLYSILMEAQPDWLDIPEEYLEKMVESVRQDGGGNLLPSLRKAIKEKFLYIKKPPKWLQSPQWMFSNGEPLKFIGQTDITDIRHDTAQLYIFYDEKNDRFLTIEQAA